MTFDKIVEHLGYRGFATRKKWTDMYIFFGMDNVLEEVVRRESLSGLYQFPTQPFKMNLQDIKADDWEIVNLRWECPGDYMMPFLQENYPW